MVDRLVDSEANARRIASVEDNFGTSGVSLSSANRVLVGEGVLTKQCRKQLKTRQFFLFNDILVYGTIIINRKKFNNQHILPLNELQIVTLDDIGDRQFGWQIISPKKSFNVYAATNSERSEWITHLRTCIDSTIKRGERKSTTDPAPAWIPDDAATHCMICTKSKFSAMNRKHHCRKCGKICCNPCSTKRLLMPSQSAEPVRVCDPCFTEASVRQSAPSVRNDSSGDDDSGTDTGPAVNDNDTETDAPPTTFY